MVRTRSIPARLGYLAAGLALVVSLNRCKSSEILGSIRFEVEYVFVNNSNAEAEFHGSGFDALPLIGVPVAPGATGLSGAPGETGDETADVTAWVVVGGQTKDTKRLTVPIAENKKTIVTVTWSGTALTISAASPCAGAPAAVAPAGPSAAASCEASKTWTLVGLTGTAAGNWADQAASASGTMTFNVPATVEEGQTYSVSATFSGSITVNAGWSGYSTNLGIGIHDGITFGVDVDNTANTGALAVGTLSKSVTVNGAWVIPSNPTSLGLRAAGGWTMGGNSSPPALVATYTKAP